MKRLLLSTLLLTSATGAFAKDIFELTKLGPNRAALYLGASRFSDNDVREVAVPIELTLSHNLDGERRCFKAARAGDTEKETLLASVSAIVSGNLDKHLSWNGNDRHDGISDYAVAGRLTLCTTEKTYWHIESGYKFDDSEREFETSINSEYPISVDHLMYVGVRMLNPTWFRPLEAAAFFTHFDVGGETYHSTMVAMSVRKEATPGFEITGGLQFRSTARSPVTSAATLSVQKKYAGIFWSGAYKRGFTRANNSNYVELGMYIPL